MICEYLQKYLPNGIELLTGFILRPATKTGKNDKSREKETDRQSTQLDIIVYDIEHYPVFLRFGSNVIVPPEGVIGVISVKKTLHDTDVKAELNALYDASRLCHCRNDNNEFIRGSFLALVSMKNAINNIKTSATQLIFNQIKKCYSTKSDLNFNDAVGLVTSLTEYSVFKKRPKNKLLAQYVSFHHEKDEEYLGLEFVLTGLLSVYYDKSRNYLSRPGLTSFQSGRTAMKLGEIPVSSIES